MELGATALNLDLLSTELAQAIVEVEEVKGSVIIKEDEEDRKDGKALKAQA